VFVGRYGMFRADQLRVVAVEVQGGLPQHSLDVQDVLWHALSLCNLQLHLLDLDDSPHAAGASADASFQRRAATCRNGQRQITKEHR